MAEFTKLSEVAQIESVSDNATVLVEENGEIVRVPKTSVGGAGGYVAVLTTNDFENPAVEWNGGPVISENYDEMYDVLSAGGIAWIDTTAISNVASAVTSAAVNPTNYGSMLGLVMAWVITDIGLLAVVNHADAPMSFLFPNGSHNLPPVEN